MSESVPIGRFTPRRGRGALSNADSRFLQWRRERDEEADDDMSAPTRIRFERVRQIITYNRSPDIPFDRSLNPYRGCEHGCIYCFARPSHAWLGMSPGLDFERQLVVKENAVQRLRETLSRPGYRCSPLALGVNTDAYQPLERHQRLTRGILEVLADFQHPVVVITKGALIERDLDLLGGMADRALVRVYLSVTSMDRQLVAKLEPRAVSVARRLHLIRRLHERGIPTGVLVAPVIPGLTDDQLERVLYEARQAGAGFAGYTMLRLPGEVEELFVQWLAAHLPQRAAKVMARIRAVRAGRLNDGVFGRRMRGEGVEADLIAQRFRLACKRYGYGVPPVLECSLFRPPSGQLSLSL